MSCSKCGNKKRDIFANIRPKTNVIKKLNTGPDDPPPTSDGCCCGKTIPNVCQDFCGEGLGIECDKISQCWLIDLSAYQPSVPDIANCKYAFAKYEMCYNFICGWVGPYCNCYGFHCADPLPVDGDGNPQPYGTCGSCDFGCKEINTEGEGTRTFFVEMDILCRGLPFLAYVSGSNVTFYDADGIGYFTGNPTVDIVTAGNAVVDDWMRLRFVGSDFFPFVVYYKCKLSEFKCSGSNTFTKVFEDPTYAAPMGWPASLVIKSAVPYCDVL